MTPFGALVIDVLGGNIEWADRKAIEDPDDCSGNSNSFIEGCRAWAEEQAEEQDDERDADGDDDE